MKFRSLQFKISFFIGIVLTLSCFVLTFNSIISSLHYYGPITDFVIHINDSMKDEIEITKVSPDTKYSYKSSVIADEIEVAIPKSYVYSPILIPKYFSLQNIVAMILIIILSILLTYFITGKILKPLKNLSEDITQIDEHNLDWRINIPKSTDEVSHLANSFNDMLQRLEEAFIIKKQFAANAAHELKTPLTIIKASLQVLNLDDSPSIDDYKESFNYIEQSLEKLIDTVNNLISLTNESIKDNFEKIKLKEILQQILFELSDKIKEKNINISLSEREFVIRGHKTLIFRAFYNLIENSIKYNKANGTINIYLENKVPNKVNIIISDSGFGMSESDLKHIYEPFFRANHKISENIDGSGLGMSIVKLIIEKHNGEINIESKKDLGTSISINLNLN